MSEATTAEATKSVAKEIGKFAVKATAQTAVEVTAAVTILLAVGLVAHKLQERKAKKAALTVVPE